VRHNPTISEYQRDASVALEREAFQLVLMDIEMPEMNGLQSTVAIRSRERISGGRTPVIAMTAHAMSGDREPCWEAGMDDYITKPIRRADLMDLVSRHAGESPTILNC
jgi:CheY-like chemotaxis protein